MTEVKGLYDDAEEFFDDLTKQVTWYLAAKAELDQLYQETEQHESQQPKQPTFFENAAQLRDFASGTIAWQGKKTGLEAKCKDASERRDMAYKAIIKALPVSNVWFKVTLPGGAAWAVGAYTEAWGGHHFEVEITPWEDVDVEKPPKDRLYYP